MMNEEQVKARIAALEKQREELRANLNATEGALIVLREVLAPKPEPTTPQETIAPKHNRRR